VGLWLLVLRRLEFLSDRVLALLAILGPGICIDSWRLVLVEGISGLRQGEQSRAHPGALNLVNVFGVWIKMDLRGGGRSPVLACPWPPSPPPSTLNLRLFIPVSWLACG
jgi:hypothetical protein